MSEGLLFAVETSLSRLSYSEQSSAQRVFTLLWELEAEVNNGGFWQYFYNLSGEHAPEAPDALRAIGANRCASLVDRALTAVAILPEDYAIEDRRREIVNGLTSEVRDSLNELDTEFYTYPDNLSALLTDFIQAHRYEFSI
ncbi:protein of unknown function [Bryocella elongata]|uniref:DNA mimic protein DMP19 C-terminal domain-containing protein n=1 Tax=Bryocella elongata TaxID=863522 RepID=A0A1H6BNH3_9BACT|nr:DMP19 family protein [Bryocella elongata]SEG62233.1 protein of unknown function [Bryocella elongata]